MTTPPPAALAPEDVARRYKSVGGAVKAGDVASVRILAELLKDGLTPAMVNQLLWAGASSIKPDMAAELVRLGAQPRMLHYVAGTADQINSATHAAMTGNTELLAWFIAQGHFTVDDADIAGNSLLAVALMHGQLETASRLKDLGANLNSCNLHQETAFHQVAGLYQVQSMVWLVGNGADPTLEADDGSDVAMCVPEFVEGAGGCEWHPDVMHRFIGEYAQAFSAARQAGLPIPVMDVPPDVQCEMALERGPEPAAQAAPPRPRM